MKRRHFMQTIDEALNKLKKSKFRSKFHLSDRDKKYIDDLNKMYQERRDAAEKGFGELGWKLKPSKATFYLWLPVPKGMTSEEFVTVMLEKAHVVVPPGNGYGSYGEGYFRVALTKDVDTIKECIRRMKEAGISYQ